ncbi:hypothetical protein ACFOZ0_04230 [Streptomyces yaanensis]|uniref:Uncharacterized protein n=1 Tax=Streptomyces yaanensis TaxID=1142239 RepID=A0ABV7S8E2_9ACTN|nr:hypothetical protein [Streptomyces sp. CGMCC 4.7035]WNC00070.1 hypothetical protein Q2K21_19450 [Streptomyces sp. CGMCC 4.7035]
MRHRLVRLLARRRPPPARPSRQAELRALTALLDEAVEAQRGADEAVAACGEPGPVRATAARECGQHSVTFHRLSGRLNSLPVTYPDLAEARARAGRLLAYHQWMVRQAMDLAFTAHADARTEAARLRLNGLGRPADDLRGLRDLLRGQAERSSP